MKKKAIKVFSMMVSAVIVTGMLSGCNSGSGTTTQSPTAAPAATTAAASDADSATEPEAAADTSAIDTSNFVTVSHLSLGNKPANGTYEEAKAQWDQYLMDQGLNAALEIQYIGWTDYMTNYNLLLATGEGLDMINSATDWLEMWPNAQRGAFLELNDLLPVYAPVTWSTVPASSWEEVTYEGHIVAIPEDMYSQWINHGFMYRQDWASEFGITNPITTFAGIGEYLQGVKDNYSSQGVVPWDVFGTSDIMAIYDGWIATQTDAVCIDSVPSGFAFAPSDAQWDVVISMFMPQADGSDPFLDFAREMKTWADAGYFREDVLNASGDTWAQFKAGLNGIRQHHTQTYVSAAKELEKEIPGANLQFFPYSAERGNLVKMSITHGATTIAANSKNPERALMVYDLIRNDETMYKLFNWGIEGRSYVINSEGKKDWPEGYTTDKDSYSSNFWGGRMDSIEFKYPSVNWIDNWEELYSEFDAIATDYRYGRFVFDRTPVETELANCGDVKSRLMPAICVGKAGDPDKAVEEFRAQLKLAGLDKILEETQNQMTAFSNSIK